MIESKCPACGRLLQIADEFAGRQARCPMCNSVYQVPSREQQSAAEAESGGRQPEQDAVGGQPDETQPQSPSKPPVPAQPAVAAELIQFDAPDQPTWQMKTPEGHVYGPITRAEMDRWVEEGRVTAECELQPERSAPWRPADQFFPVLRPIPPAQRFSPPPGHYGGPPGYYGPPARPANPPPRPASNPPPRPVYRPSSRPSAAAADPPAGAEAQSSSSAAPVLPPSSSLSPSPSAAEAQSPRSRSPYVASNRGSLVLVLALFGLVTCPVFSVLAWVMGGSDLKEMKEGRMNEQGRRLTLAGYYLAMVTTILWIAAVMVTFFIIMVQAANS